MKIALFEITDDINHPWAVSSLSKTPTKKTAINRGSTLKFEF